MPPSPNAARMLSVRSRVVRLLSHAILIFLLSDLGSNNLFARPPSSLPRLLLLSHSPLAIAIALSLSLALTPRARSLARSLSLLARSLALALSLA
eukprot:6194649-Pleurochrysis_carterae.AAC.1